MSIVEDSAAITSGLSSIGWFGFYVFKNGLVGLLCVLTGRITWGAYPFLVIMVNSVLLGCMALLLNDVQGVSALSFFAGIAPHGIVEIFAICLSCALGMRSGKMREKLVMFAKPFGLLLIAAAIETFISPLIIARVL
jgi:stage II sporulation protein M